VVKGRSGRVGAMGDSLPELVIGIPSVARPTNYLLATLTSLWERTSAAEKARFRVVVFNADVPAAQNEEAQAIAEAFPKAVESGTIEVVSRAEPHPELERPEGLSSELGCDPARLQWRAKQVLDAAWLMNYCAPLAPWYLHLEDDVEAAEGCVARMLEWIEQRRLLGRPFAQRTDWLMISFATPFGVRWDGRRISPRRYGGFVGHLFRSTNLGELAAYLRANFEREPLDWLVGGYAAETGLAIRGARGALFQHIGDVSSLDGKRSTVRVPGFRG